MENKLDDYPMSGEEPGEGIATRASHQGEAMRWSNIRNIAFKGLLVLFSLIILAMFNVVLVMIVVSWLPDATYVSIIGEEAADLLVHRVHDSIIPITAWSMLIGTIVQLHRPQKRVVPLLMALSVPLVFTIVELATGTLVLSETTLSLVVLVLIVLLHPGIRKLTELPRLDGVMAGLTVAAAAVWIPFAFRQAQIQRLAIPGDPHTQMEHWNRMAVFGLLLVIWALVGSSDYPGWRLTAWIAGLSSTWYGSQSLLFPSASAAPLPWAIAAIGWGIAYIVVSERRARLTQQDQRGELAAQLG
jgi:hypothetical protein